MDSHDPMDRVIPLLKTKPHTLCLVVPAPHREDGLGCFQNMRPRMDLPGMSQHWPESS
jgi:hypothetical protein